MSHTAPNLLRARSTIVDLFPILEELGITRIDLFGSRAREDNRPDSDWDFAVHFSRPITSREYWRLKKALAKSFGGKIDLRSPQYTSAEFMNCISPECRNVVCLP